MASPFDFLDSINNSKKNLLEDGAVEKDYAAFIVNRGLSLFPDTILHANEMNLNHHLDVDMQYDYLLYSVRKANRRSKWPKNILGDDVKLVREHFKINLNRANEVLKLLTPEQLNELRELYEWKK